MHLEKLFGGALARALAAGIRRGDQRVPSLHIHLLDSQKAALVWQ